MAKRDTVPGPNQLWETDMKYGYVEGTDEWFFWLSLLDVFDRSIIDYRLWLSCTGADASRVLRNTIETCALTSDGPLPKVRAGKDAQFGAFGGCDELKLVHQRNPAKTTDLDTHSEAFSARSVVQPLRFRRSPGGVTSRFPNTSSIMASVVAMGVLAL